MFKYLFEKMNIFAPPMNDWACGNRRHINNEEEDMEAVIDIPCLYGIVAYSLIM